MGDSEVRGQRTSFDREVEAIAQSMLVFKKNARAAADAEFAERTAPRRRLRSA